MAQAASVLDSEPPSASFHGRDYDDIVVLRNVSWDDFQRILRIRGEKSVPRLSYLEGDLEFMSPSRSHEMIKSMIGRLVEAWCMERGVGITPYGQWTHKSKRMKRAAEP